MSRTFYISKSIRHNAICSLYPDKNEIEPTVQLSDCRYHQSSSRSLIRVKKKNYAKKCVSTFVLNKKDSFISFNYLRKERKMAVRPDTRHCTLDLSCIRSDLPETLEQRDSVEKRK